MNATFNDENKRIPHIIVYGLHMKPHIFSHFSIPILRPCQPTPCRAEPQREFCFGCAAPVDTNFERREQRRDVNASLYRMVTWILVMMLMLLMLLFLLLFWYRFCFLMLSLLLLLGVAVDPIFVAGVVLLLLMLL